MQWESDGSNIFLNEVQVDMDQHDMQMTRKIAATASGDSGILRDCPADAARFRAPPVMIVAGGKLG